MSATFFENYTKSRLLSIFQKLNDTEPKNSWSKPKLLQHLKKYSSKAILDVFTSAELKEGLEILETQSSGSKQVRHARLLELIGGESQTGKTTKSSGTAKESTSITIEGFDVPLSAKVQLIWEGPHLHWRTWGEDYVDAYMDHHGTELRKVAALWRDAKGLSDFYFDLDCNYSLYSSFVKKENWGPGNEKEHAMDGYIEAEWKTLKHMLDRSSPSVLNPATKMRLVIGKHAVLELTRFKIAAKMFGKKD